MPGYQVSDWDDAYANAPNIPSGDRWPEAWIAPAAEFRAAMGRRAELDIAYGDDARARFDLFRPETAARGLLVFIHGGFWMRLDKSYWSHLASGALERGWAVAIPSYSLCPEVRVSEITRQVAAAIEKAAQLVAGPILLSGHSAGGQLVSRMVSETTPLSEATTGRVERVLSISGLHDLRPLLHTALNDTIGLDPDEAARESPALLHPLRGTRLTCWVGASERAEFIRQNALLANVWRGLGIWTDAVEEPDRHHFDIIDGLADPSSAMATALLGEG